MRYRILCATGIRANPSGSKDRPLSRGEIVAPETDWQAEDLESLVAGGYAERLEHPGDGAADPEPTADPETKAVDAAPENKAIESAPEQAEASKPEGAVSARHKGGGRWAALDADGAELPGALFSKDQAKAWGLIGD